MPDFDGPASFLASLREARGRGPPLRSAPHLASADRAVDLDRLTPRTPASGQQATVTAAVESANARARRRPEASTSVTAASRTSTTTASGATTIVGLPSIVSGSNVASTSTRSPTASVKVAGVDRHRDADAPRGDHPVPARSAALDEHGSPSTIVADATASIGGSVSARRGHDRDRSCLDLDVATARSSCPPGCRASRRRPPAVVP